MRRKGTWREASTRFLVLPGSIRSAEGSVNSHFCVFFAPGYSSNSAGFCRRGFNQETYNARHGLGLHLMRERVEELYGEFDLNTAPGRGTRITVSLPREEASD
jgi:light-regulated signal transduction histidine kinase (bacteriophytochrome)